MKICLFLLVASVGLPQDIVWTHQSTVASYPGASGQLNIYRDPVSKQIIMPLVGRSNGSIYVSAFYAYNPLTNVFTLMNGDPAGTGCISATSTQPGNGHPDEQMSVDTARNRIVLVGGLNQGCNGGSPPNDSPRHQMYTLALNADPADNTVWAQVSPAAWPSLSGSSQVYDPNTDIIFQYGATLSTAGHIYCLDSGSGMPTAAQTAAGCTSLNTWIAVFPVNGVASCTGTSCTRVSGDSFTILSANDAFAINSIGNVTFVASVADGDHLTLQSTLGTQTSKNWYTQPLGVVQAAAFYALDTQRIIFFGGVNGADTLRYADTWSYNVQGKKYTKVGLSTTVPTVDCVGNCGQVANLAYNQVTKCAYYHQGTGTGSPKDYLYCPATDTWTLLTTTGSGPTASNVQAYTELCNCLVNYANTGGTGSAPSIWLGALPPVAGGSTLSGGVTMSGNGGFQ